MSQGTAFGNRWWIVFGAMLSMMLAQGPVILYTLGLFIKPLNQEFGWESRKHFRRRRRCCNLFRDHHSLRRITH